MKEYNYDEIRQMQEKALERVRDMQVKTHQIVNGEQEKKEKTQEQKNYRDNFYNAVKSASKADYIKMPVEYPEKINNYESFEKYFGPESENNADDKSEAKKIKEKSGFNIEELIKEPDKALLLALILLLQADHADEELLMSLLYIML